MKITKIAAVFLVMAFSGKMMAQETEKQLLIKDAIKADPERYGQD